MDYLHPPPTPADLATESIAALRLAAHVRLRDGAVVYPVVDAFMRHVAHVSDADVAYFLNLAPELGISLGVQQRYETLLGELLHRFVPAPLLATRTLQ